MHFHNNRFLASFLALTLCAMLISSVTVFAGTANAAPVRDTSNVKKSSDVITKSDVLSSDDVADALDIDPTRVLDLSFGSSDPVGYHVGDVFVENMPGKGKTYLVISTGDAHNFIGENVSPSTSTTLTSKGPTGNDMVQLMIKLKVPSGTTGASFDWVFESEEFPEFVPSAYNDAFFAEFGDTSNITFESNVYTAPNNVAFDGSGQLITINTTGELGMTAENALGTIFDGATKKLTTTFAIPAGKGEITMFFSVHDAGDSIYDTKVILDNFQFLTKDVGSTPVTEASKCGPIDLAIALDNTGSMGGAINNVIAELNTIVSDAQTASGNDLRLGLVTFKDEVIVKNKLTTDLDAVKTNINAEFASGGAGAPESSDEAKNTVVNNLVARPGQSGDFNEPWRTEATKILVLITDAPPGGFNDLKDPEDVARMHAVAVTAAALGIRVSDVFVPTAGDYDGQAAILLDDAVTSGGSFITTNADGTGTAQALKDLVDTCGKGKIPVANAGPDQSVPSASTVTLDGTGSFDPQGTPLKYSWTQTGGTTVTLSDATSSQPTFTAPTATSANVELTFSLTVSDGTNTSAADTVTIIVKGSTVENHPPVAFAGYDYFYPENSVASLYGSGSTDEDGDPLTYGWVQIGGPEVVLSDPTSPDPTFTTPDVLKEDVLLSFILKVTDPSGEGSTDSVDVTVYNTDAVPTTFTITQEGTAKFKKPVGPYGKGIHHVRIMISGNFAVSEDNTLTLTGTSGFGTLTIDGKEGFELNVQDIKLVGDASKIKTITFNKMKIIGAKGTVAGSSKYLDPVDFITPEDQNAKTGANTLKVKINGVTFDTLKNSHAMIMFS